MTDINTIAGNGLDDTAPTQIQREGRHTAVVYDGTDGANRAIALPPGANVGDVVQIFRDRNPSGPDGPLVFPPSGETFYHSYSPSGGVTFGYFVKVASTEWGILA